MTPAERVAFIEAEAVGSDLSSGERYEFLPSIKQRVALTEKQEKVLAEIEWRLTIGGRDD